MEQTVGGAVALGTVGALWVARELVIANADLVTPMPPMRSDSTRSARKMPRYMPIMPTADVTAASLARYAFVAAFAAMADGLSKFFVVRRFGSGGGFPIFDRFSVFVTFNEGSAGGVMIGPYTWHLNVLMTAFALLLITGIVRQLSAVDSRATTALGLVAGGAIGNMCSMIWGPPGVADFFAIRINAESTVVMNVADLALWSGALLLVPVVIRLVKAIRTERRPRTHASSMMSN